MLSRTEGMAAGFFFLKNKMTSIHRYLWKNTRIFTNNLNAENIF